MSDKPRVLQICHDYKGPFRTVARQYAGCFVDCEIKTIFLRGARSEAISSKISGDVEYLQLEPGALSGLKLEPARRVREMIGDEVPDILIAHRYKPFYLAQLLNRQLDIGLILGVMHEYGFLGRMGRQLMSHFWKSNVELIGVSQPVCDEVIQARPGLKDRVHMVPHCIEAPTLLDPVTARHELGIPLGSYCYGTIGRLVRKKNHMLLLDGFAKLEDNAVLAIVGEGDLDEELKKRARRLGIADRVVFCGHRDDARRYMKAFDSFVLPSTREEAFGMVLLEAMAASIPVLSSDAPGPASVVGDTAVLFREGDADDLAEKLGEVRAMSKVDRENITARALERLGEKYSVMAMMQRLRNLEPVVAQAPVTF